MQKTIGLVIKEIADEKNLKVSQLYKQLGMSKQAVYNSFAKDRFKHSDYVKWSEALQVSIEELKRRETGLSNFSEDNGAFGSVTLDTIKRLLEVELKEKNEQIRSLQESLRESQRLASALLGKLHEYSTSPVIALNVLRDEVQFEDQVAA